MSSISLEDYLVSSGTRYGKISYIKNDGPIGDSLRSYGEWAQNEIDVTAKFIKPGNVVLDVGANIGTHALAYSVLVQDTGKVIAFEPQPLLFTILEKNVNQNHLRNVEVKNCGLGENNITIDIPELDLSERTNFAGIPLDTAQTKNGNGKKVATNPVEVKTLDSLGISKVDLIKIDVEGMELGVLKGAAGLIKSNFPVLQLEANSIAGAVYYINYLKELDYVFYFMSTKAFNPANFFQNADNWFHVAHESNIIAIHKDDEESLTVAEETKDALTKFESLDELAGMILETPRAGDKTDYERNPARLKEIISHLEPDAMFSAGIRAAYKDQVKELEERAASFESRFKVVSQENQKLIEKISSLEDAVNASRKLQKEVDELKRETSRLQNQVDTLKTANSSANRIAEESRNALQSVFVSRSWRITSPLRKLTGVFK